jgi:hypothetical protein
MFWGGGWRNGIINDRHGAAKEHQGHLSEYQSFS